jgi:hypothetical protein
MRGGQPTELPRSAPVWPASPLRWHFATRLR